MESGAREERSFWVQETATGSWSQARSPAARCSLSTVSWAWAEVRRRTATSPRMNCSMCLKARSRSPWATRRALSAQASRPSCLGDDARLREHIADGGTDDRRIFAIWDGRLVSRGLHSGDRRVSPATRGDASAHRAHARGRAAVQHRVGPVASDGQCPDRGRGVNQAVHGDRCPARLQRQAWCRRRRDRWVRLF